MTVRGRVALGGVSFVAIILVVFFILSYRLLNKSLPKIEGTIRLDILEQPVDVYRDQYGVPHIFAENEADVFRASGFVTAQDRLWQMDLSRRAATGRLAEIFGSSLLDSDKFIRTWGFHRVAKEIVPILSPQSKEALEAYTQGINAFINTHQSRLPLEFAILRYQPEPWKIEDSLAIIRFMAWRLSFSWYVDPVLAKLVEKVGLNRAREVFPDFPAEGPTILSATSGLSRTALQEFVSDGLALRDFLGIEAAALGSNSWVVSGEKSVCGKPLLANDPHLELVTPSVWYEMHMNGGRFNVAGVALPGTPTVLIGHTAEIAWGLTNGMIDDVDFYLERLNPENVNQYQAGTEWMNLEEIREDIFIKDKRPQTLTIKRTRNGPVVSDIHPAVSDSGAVWSMRWTGHTPSDELAALLEIQTASSWNDFRDALKHFKVPAQNFIFASVGGEIGYQLAGAIPIRKKNTGVLPHQGWADAGQWEGYIPFETLPHFSNPPRNFIATANNKIAADEYPYYLTNLWEPHSRSARIQELLSAQEKFTIDDFKTMQSDLTSPMSGEIMAIVLTAIQPKVLAGDNNILRDMYDLCKDWKGEETEDSIAAAIFHAFMVKLAENTLQDEMGEELYSHYIRLSNVPTRVLHSLLRTDRARWFDNVTTEARETRDEIIVQSMLDAHDMLVELAGTNISDWAWGKIHTLTMAHSLGRQSPFDKLLNLGPYSRGGSSTTINNNQYAFSRPFAARVGASTRQIVDLCDPTHSFSVITSGQSGQRMGDHYKDQTPLWLSGLYHQVTMDEIEIQQSAKGHLILEVKATTN